MKVILHSNAESAADATDRTLKMIPMGGDAHLKRGADGKALLSSARELIKSYTK